jgi:hypothetical protein
VDKAILTSDDFRDALLGKVDDQVRALWSLVLDVDTCNTLVLAGARLSVHTTAVMCLAVLEGRGDVDGEEVATGAGGVENSALDGVPGGLFGGDGGSDDSGTGPSEFRSDESKTLEVLGALFRFGGVG